MDNRILGIADAVLVIVGIFLPLVTVSVAEAGLNQSASFFDSIKAGGWEGIVLLLAAVASVSLAALRKYRLLLITDLGMRATESDDLKRAI